ncbi:phage Gp37/Gp68 family protein [Cupriavidus plantarum]|uniref:phage Gp37/Gp68 family protein n=1 Tax=Cupriavidus plantarum TaxID=942865 RepID=UPI00339DA755
MSENSKIEWTDHTFNPWIGCTKVSPGCDNCYAEQMMDKRMHKVEWGPRGVRVRTSAANWREPIKWNARHASFFAEHGRRQRVFCASLADVFDNAVSPVWRGDLFNLIEQTPNLDWLLLTKRIGNVKAMLEQLGLSEMPENVWLGATIINQEEADRDIPKLLATPARVRFLSMEPLLGPVDLSRHLWKCCGNRVPGHPGDGWMQPPDPPECCGDVEPAGLHWVIAGGESGQNARPIHPDWARSLRDQCEAAGVPFMFKQWGEWLGAGQDGAYDHDPVELNASDAPARVGKKAAGRLLDGRQHDGFPEPRA